jgi:hypothetical protein
MVKCYTGIDDQLPVVLVFNYLVCLPEGNREGH